MRDGKNAVNTARDADAELLIVVSDYVTRKDTQLLVGWACRNVLALVSEGWGVSKATLISWNQETHTGAAFSLSFPHDQTATGEEGYCN